MTPIDLFEQRQLIELLKRAPYGSAMRNEPFANGEPKIPNDAFALLDGLVTCAENLGYDTRTMCEVLENGSVNGTSVFFMDLLLYGRRLNHWPYLYRCIELAGSSPVLLEYIASKGLPFTHFSGSSGIVTTLQHGLQPRLNQEKLGITGALGEYDVSGGEEFVYLHQWPSIGFMHFFILQKKIVGDLSVHFPMQDSNRNCRNLKE